MVTPNLLKFLKQVVMTLEPFGFKLRTIQEQEAIQLTSHFRSGQRDSYDAIELPPDFRRICGFSENDPLAIFTLTKHQKDKGKDAKITARYVLFDYHMENGKRVGGGPIMNSTIAGNWLANPDNVLHYYTEMKKVLNTTELNHDDIDILGI